jgi:ABC-type lipoprotein export system ATPase subunit
MDLIELKNICKTYHIGQLDVEVLKGISLAVRSGEFVSVMGSSGSGKSTLMNILGCLDRPTSGNYLLGGQEISSLSLDQRAFIRNHNVGFVFQNFNLLPRTSAIDNVMIPLAYSSNGISDRQGRERAMALLCQFGMADRIDHEPSQLSGGEQQRVAIARALINQPSIILADEPTGNLDSNKSNEVMTIFEQLNNEQGITIILVTHDPDVALYSKRIIHILDGMIKADELVDDNRHKSSAFDEKNADWGEKR